MSNEEELSAEREYIAFISYRHKPLDSEAAQRIQKKIENYTVPKEYRDRIGGKRLGMVFRDEDELPASASLSGSITYALDHSKYLLVICTPDLPKSTWCEQEIRYFLKTHDRDHLLAILVDGEPGESFSPLMLHTFDEEGNITGDTEPLAANIAGANHRINNKAFRKEIVRVFAALLQCPFDALWQRQRRAKTNRLAALMGVGMAILMVFAGVVFSKNKQITEQNTQILEQNAQITEQNTRITEQNQEITDKNRELRRQLSSILVDNGMAQLERHDVQGSLQSALDALPREAGDPFDPRVEALLTEALCAYQTGTIQSRILFEQALNIVDLATTEDGEYALLADPLGYVRCVSLRDGSLKWETLSREEPASEEADTDLLVPAGKGVVLCKNYSRVMALDTESGEPVWKYNYNGVGNNFYCLSPDGNQLLILDQEDWQDPELLLVVLDTATGAELGRGVLGSEETPLSLIGTTFHYNYASAFSDDGKLFGFARQIKDEKGKTYCAVLDTETWEVLHSHVIEGVDSSPVFYGLCLENETGNLLCMQYESGYGGIMVTGIDWANEETSRDLVNKTLNSWTGLNLDVLEEQLFVPALTNKYLAVVFVQESMFVFDRPSGELRRGYAFGSAVVSAHWEDRENSSLVLMTADGTFARYTLAHEPGTALLRMTADSLDQSSISIGQALDSENAYARYLTVPADNGGQLLAVSMVSDPCSKAVEEPGETILDEYRFLPTPSGEKIFFVFPRSGEYSIVLRDAATLEEISNRTIPRKYYLAPVVLDEEHLIQGFKIYGMDGSETYLDNLSEENTENLSDSDINSVKLFNGQTLTAYYCSYRDYGTLIPVWLDGKLVTASQENETGIAFRSCSELAMGENGFVVGFGDCAETHADGSLRPATKYAFFVFDALHGTRRRVEDPFRLKGEREICMGRRTPVMACMNEDSQIFILSLTDGSAYPLPAEYMPGEVKALCFSPDDSYLMVLTQSGMLEIYHLPDGEKVFSQVPSLFGDVNVSYVMALDCQVDREGKAFLISATNFDHPFGCLIIIDPESWTILAQTQNIYTYLSADDGIYAQRDYKLVRYPFHRLEDLADLAKQELEKWADS